jgi:hypothetical protein
MGNDMINDIEFDDLEHEIEMYRYVLSWLILYGDLNNEAAFYTAKDALKKLHHSYKKNDDFVRIQIKRAIEEEWRVS